MAIKAVRGGQHATAFPGNEVAEAAIQTAQHTSPEKN